VAAHHVLTASQPASDTPVRARVRAGPYVAGVSAVRQP
jgi:hypothetical protein